MSSTIHIKFPFSQEKGNSMLEYLLNKCGRKYNYMALVKLAFFADRYHIRNYARPISFDKYVAMKFGAVPSNLLNCILFESYEQKNMRIIPPYEVELIDEPTNMKELSETDIEALDFSIKNFSPIGKRNQFDIANLTHAYPEWDRYRERFLKYQDGREDMYYEDFLLNANPDHEEFKKLNITDPFPPLSQIEQEFLLGEMQEYCANV